MWQNHENRLALLEFLVLEEVPCRARTERAYEVMKSWGVRTGRAQNIALRPAHRPRVEALLTRVWPEWEEVLLELRARHLDPTPSGWRALEDARRIESLDPLPEALNIHTAVAHVGPHAKANLSQTRRAALGDTRLHHDGLIRARLPEGMCAKLGDERLELDDIQRMFGEVSLPQRALRDGLRLTGRPRGILFVENLGTWRDMAHPQGWILALLLGWDMRGALLLAAQFPAAKLRHFGDLDPNGARIFYSLRKKMEGLEWFVPEFWGDYIETRAHECQWPDDLLDEQAPVIVKEMARDGKWMEQEVITLDPRLIDAFET